MNWQTYLTSQLQLTLGTEGTKSCSQTSHLVRTHQRSHLYTSTRIGCLRTKSRTFTKRLNFLFLYLFFFSALTSASLFSYRYSYPLHFPSFSCVTTHCPPSQLPFLLHLIHSLPLPSPPPSYPSPICHHTTPPSYTLTTHCLVYCTNCTQPLPPEIPDTSTLYYNNRNTPKHTQGP
jgi:hypothetical protein